MILYKTYQTMIRLFLTKNYYSVVIQLTWRTEKWSCYLSGRWSFVIRIKGGNMSKIKVLDCTLRDGGYLNNWNFGKDDMRGILKEMNGTGAEIVEVGFLRDEEYVEGRAVFDSVKRAKEFIGEKYKNVQYAVMSEAINPLPLEKIQDFQEDGPEIVRVIVWKRLLKEGYEYCKGVVEKGYRLCVQPNRVDQYSKEEFVEMIQLFNQLKPMAIYVVDSFGILNSSEIMEYAEILDKHLEKGTSLGYHGHNNLQQAFGTAVEMILRNFDRELILDASVWGIGRGAGNLNMELLAKYMNEHCESQYDISCMVRTYENYIKKIYKQEKWGYTAAYYLTALYRCNPLYARYYDMELNLPETIIHNILSHIEGEDKVRFGKEKADIYMRKYGG